MIKVAGQVFKSQADMEARLKSMFASNGMGVAGAPLHAFLQALLARHPEADVKIGSGVRAFQLGRNKLNPKGVHITLHRTDGSSDDFSWKTCISGRKSTPHHDNRAAMRTAVMSQTASAKAKCCVQCQSTDGLEVDHVVPFADLASKFEASHTLGPFKRIGMLTTLQDPAWANFHREHAVLQTLCKTCHNIKTFGKTTTQH
jgi:5-methylcytosine-specific restriction endonuclease McrA